MKKFILLTVVGLLSPALAFASTTVTSVSLNGDSSTQVDPGGNIVVSVTAVLSGDVKWKGTNWGISTSSAITTCANTKNAHSHEDGNDDDGGDRDDRHSTGTFTESFIAKAPRTPGLYGITVEPDGENKCGKPLSAPFTLPQSIRVGNNTALPTFKPYSDITVQLLASSTGITVSYPLPVAVDTFGNSIVVSCVAAPGSFFAVGNSTVICNATDAWGNHAIPEIFTITVVPPPDTVPPIFFAHANLTVPATGPSGATVVFSNPSAYDNVDGSADPVFCSPASGSTFAVGTTTVTCTVSDVAGNSATTTFSVAVRDTTPPVIASAPDISVTLAHAILSSTTVTYSSPIATDNFDGTDPVSCLPASGSLFQIGSTTVTCSATDAAGNHATPVTFVVGVYPFVPQPVVLASQPDESYMCLPDESNGWEACYTGGNTFLQIPLGSGSTLQGGSIKNVTVALDPNFAPLIPAHPFVATLSCFTDALYTSPCTDWVQFGTGGSIFSTINTTTDNKHWSASFSSAHNFDGSSPLVFDPTRYYQLKINETGGGWPAFGQDPTANPSAQPYWVINGLTQ